MNRVSLTDAGGGVRSRPGPDVIDRAAAVLARSLPLSGLAVVPADRPGRMLWHDGSPGADDLDALTVLGRARLSSAATTAGLGAGPDAGGAILGIDLRDPEGVRRGVLFAVLRAGEAWTDLRRAALDAVCDIVHPELLDLLDRPRPAREAADGRPRLEKQLREAAERGEFVLLYQPEIDMRSGAVLALEALVRWDHPQRGRLGPDDFIGEAERSDVIKVLGSWVIENAVRDFASWHDDRVTLRINVSPAQLSGDGIVGQLERALRANGVPARQIGIEFTETAASGDIAELSATLSALNALGIGSAIDDLATGYSTLSRLRMLPVDTVKIDRSLVVGIDADPRARAIVRAVMSMARELGLEVVGEGVETAEEALTLAGLGCYRGQGHRFGRPQDAAATAQLLAHDARRRGGKS